MRRRLLGGLLAAAAFVAGTPVLLAACGGDDPAPSPADSDARPSRPAPEVTRVATVDALTILGQRAVIASPKAGPTDRAVIYVHGYTQNAMAILGEPLRARVSARLLEAGYVVGASDAHGNAWGNDASVRDLRALRSELARRGAKRFFLLGESMGGLASLRLAAAGEADAWGGIYPVCNLASLTRDPLFQTSIQDAYAGTTPAPLPIGRKGLRMAFWASPRDQVVSARENTERCAREARRRGAEVTVHQTRGDHGDASNFRASEVVGFFGGAG